MWKGFFLDRDGVINLPIIAGRKPFPPRDTSEFSFCDSIRDVVVKAKQFGYKVFVVTNQPDVARGNNRRENVEDIHSYIMDQLEVDEIFVCYHDDEDHCECRKPKPGMIIDAGRKYDLNLSRSLMVGDRWRDILAGKSAGCKTVFIDYGYEESVPANAVADYQIVQIRELLGILEEVENEER